jgi:hypothetical protein
VQHRFDAGVLLNLDAETLRAHPRRRTRRVGHVDGVHTQLSEGARAFNLLAAVDSAGRHDFDERDKFAAFNQATDV